MPEATQGNVPFNGSRSLRSGSILHLRHLLAPLAGDRALQRRQSARGLILAQLGVVFVLSARVQQLAASTAAVLFVAGVVLASVEVDGAGIAQWPSWVVRDRRRPGPLSGLHQSLPAAGALFGEPTRLDVGSRGARGTSSILLNPSFFWPVFVSRSRAANQDDFALTGDGRRPSVLALVGGPCRLRHATAPSVCNRMCNGRDDAGRNGTRGTAFLGVSGDR